MIGAFVLILLSSRGERPGNNNYSRLEIVNTVSGRVHARRFVSNNEEFAVEFIHSVNNSTVREIFTVNGKEIKPAAVRFYSYGAGMPTELEEGQVMSRDGDAIVITGFNNSFTELNYNIGSFSDYLLLIREERISLRELGGMNALITLRIR